MKEVVLRLQRAQAKVPMSEVLKYRGLLSKSGLFVHLDDETIDAVLVAAQPEIREFVAKDTLWAEGDIVSGIGVLLNGALSSHRVQPNGRPQLFQVFKVPSIMNLEAAVSREPLSPVSVVASTQGFYLWFPYESLFGNEAIPDVTIHILQENLLSYLAANNIRLMNKADILARRTVRGRVMHYLALKCGGHPNGIDIGMSQEEFAHYLCVDRSSLSTELNNIRRDGIIDFDGTRYRVIPSREKHTAKNL
jgi:CRP-like cAMP-binding protein